MTTRGNLLTSLLWASASGLGQTDSNSNLTAGFKADNNPARTERGIGALMPWADALWASTYNSHRKSTGDGTWVSFETVKVSGYKPLALPQEFSAHLARVVSDTGCVAAAEFMFT